MFKIDLYPFSIQKEVKLNLPARDGQYARLSMSSVSKARYRLNKELELRPDETLNEIIEGLSVQATDISYFFTRSKNSF